MNEETNSEYLVSVANALNGLQGWDLEILNDSLKGYSTNPTKQNRDVVSSNLAELIEKLTTITEAGEKVEDEEELEKTKALLEEYIKTAKYGYGTTDLLDQVKQAYNVVLEYFKSRGFIPITGEKPELTASEESFKVSRTPPSHDELMEHARKGADALLEDTGFSRTQKEETFEELVDRRLREALQKLKEQREWEERHKTQPYYGSRGPEWWIESQEARANLSDSELHELSDNSKEREIKASKRGADKILANYYATYGE